MQVIDHPGTAVVGFGLLPYTGPKDKEYPMAAYLDKLASSEGVRLDTTHHPMFEHVLDQGETGTCVAHMGKHWERTAPVIQHARKKVDAMEIYRRTVLFDPWPQNDAPDWQFGTTLEALARYYRSIGMIKEWRHSEEEQEVGEFIALRAKDGRRLGASVWLALPFKRSMMQTDSKGFVKVSGSEQYWHATLASGYNVKGDYYRIANSWHRRWGVHGYYYLRGADMRSLLVEGGHATFALEVPLGLL
jgi:hypothetical protein